MTSEKTTDDVLIVGGGLAGLSLAASLGHAGLRVAVADRDAPATQLDEAFDGRTTAIAFGSQRLLTEIGVWSRLEADAEPIREIRVADGGSSLFLHFDHREVAPITGNAAPFGWIVENRRLRRALFERCAELPKVTHLAPMAVEDHAVEGETVTARLADGSTRRARLLVGADGRTSPTRERAGIATIGWPYRQTAIVCVAGHEKPHNGIAVEHFLAPGPFAILPMTDAPDGTHRSSIVWTERPETVEPLLAADQATFDAELQRRFGPHLGAVRTLGRRFSYPLSLLQARRFTAPRLALVGEAAHAIHPIAGQGLNLGMRDIAALAELIVDHARLGLDIGSPALLQDYARRRRVDALALSAATDVLDRLFSNDIPPIAAARRIGLAAVGQVPSLKRFFMRYAMGQRAGAGLDLPRLVRGEKL
ncbi:UbiH/UbiF/VisC/COQ6 family ubiquinone biosynthesis hydroxylase [Roseiterribacter gracilis]|uniref:2-octaprenyl-3-methyl-6-methoxy-1,4-benzoquinol hydroxylase n=1 Tax=Roseiterribacter gracilis TaxID=2812848 RepID=A0A8S8XGC7_9PROT|nr:2-octaprenyl-3-methyl-6-methoxy-1,4-benzoquinol hydroxylase [Rhodospirillales bacterium TMPK1]